MKKQLATILLSVLVLSGCSAKGAGNNTLSNNAESKQNITSEQASVQTPEQKPKQASNKTSSAESGEVDARKAVNSNFKPLDSKSLPELSPKQKSLIDSKLNSTLKNIDKTLKSLQDAPEIDLSSVGQ